MKIRLAVFDVDGTLFDSGPLVAHCYARTIAELKLPVRPPTAAELLTQVGQPVTVIMERIFPTLSAEQRREVARLALEHLVAAIRRKEGHLYPGVETVLPRLAADGMRLAIVSNARPPYLDALLETYGLRECFSLVASLAQAGETGSKGDRLGKIIAFFKVPPAQTVMVGDREADWEAARRQGTHFIACRYGHAEPGELDGAPEGIARFADLPLLLSSLSPGAIPYP